MIVQSEAPLAASIQPARTVSVIIPVYNGADFVAEAVESVLAQTVPPLEVIVVNDGSTDRTADVLAGFGDRITVIHQSNKGLPATRNVGAAASRGDWLAFLDADDTWLPTKLERQLDRAERTGAALIYTDRFNVGTRGDLPEVQSEIQRMYEGDVFEDVLLGNHITVSSVIIRRDVFADARGFNEQLRAAEDWDLWVRVTARHRVAVCHEPLVRYRFHGGMMSGDPRRMREARWHVVLSALKDARGQQLPRLARQRILSATARTNAWDAARRKQRGLALREFGRALAAAPFEWAQYRDLLRMLLGRI